MKTYDEKAAEILQKRDETIKANGIRKRKITLIAVIAAVVALTVCASAVAVAMSMRNNNAPLNILPVDTGADEVKKYNDGVIGEKKEAGKGGMYERKDSSGMYSRSDMVEEAAPSVGGDIYGDPGYLIDGPTNVVDPKAGTLSAGEWKDAANLDDWFKLLQNNAWTNLMTQRALNTKNVITVTVKDGESLCYNVTVKLLAGENVLFTARTDIEGKAYLFYNIDKNNEQPTDVLIGDKKISLEGKKEIIADIEGSGIAVTALDLMFMIDTTGSMGDELEYIKVELYDVVDRIAKAGGNMSIRVSVNFYRDKGDAYVVKYFDFREDINQCIEQIKEQTADGGGDTPEAVHTALENAVTGHQWRGDAVKICFFVMDAPPHTGQEIQGIDENILKSVKAAAEQGIRIIPVASSGVDTETEFLMRSYALLTGGTYVFITNDSHVGGNHKEAEVGEHTVEYLNECLIRIACEYCGIYTGEKIPYTPTHNQNTEQQ